MRNALDRQFVEEIEVVIDSVAAIRALIITAQGSSFCVGGGLGHLVEHFDSLSEELEHMIHVWHRCLSKLANLPISVVVGVHGGVGAVP